MYIHCITSCGETTIHVAACSAACKNCGTATSSCACSCAVGWAGNDCSSELTTLISFMLN